MGYEKRKDQQDRSTVNVELTSSPERSLIHATDSSRYIVFFTRVQHTAAAAVQPERLPLELALVLDRSGSMHGTKLQTAKQAVFSVLDRLTPRDTVSLVAFDNQIETIQSPAQVTPQLKSQLREKLFTLEARASTALHQGWLTGCNSLANTASEAGTQALKRCFLLTDGLANVGMTDPEQIASASASMREQSAISTSTFGIGTDYNELLLGPMAVAGGGQFHHLRSPEEIINTFVGELGELLSVAALQVRMEVETSQGTELDLISPYWLKSARDNPLRRIISIGDLQSSEERPIVVRCTFPAQHEDAEPQIIRARVLWRADNAEHASDWQEIRFSYASQDACAGEARDPQVMKLVAQHEADRARREAVASSHRGDYLGAQNALNVAIHSMSMYASSSSEVAAEQSSLEDLAGQMFRAPMPSEMSKEIYYNQQRRSRNSRDYRQPSQPPTPPEPPKPDDN
ncbi:vWA domain-containing protein [Dictyobacter formicarum]|uniref:VWFA domain-containing protein n=1 Tax=Dictyobacter formicarum TaxID=2778368 RepID=A0ABQ3VIW5_9CHLR|nr:VWA domain-containing protein [Dictyobacter formicarum]GHO85066.1 hypothetical protein KSZ_30720 [Dictyobacter formicarum]